MTTSIPAVEVESETSSFFSASPYPPLDLTPYISKANDQYVAGGAFGDVYRCWCDDGSPKEVAVKALRFKFAIDGDNDKSAKMLRRELGIWRRLNHMNVVPFLGITYGFGMHGAMSLVSLWMANESLHRFLAKHDNNLHLGHRLLFLLDIANGMQYLHTFPIVHGDLNSNNVLLDAHYTARLADFGYASSVGNIPEALTYLQRSTTRPGALRWTAPEQVDPEGTCNRTTKSDIYSFGCVALQGSCLVTSTTSVLILLQVLSGKQPWSEVREDSNVILQLVKGHKPSRPESRMIDDSHWNLIQRCWSPVAERPAADLIIFTIQRFLSYCPQCPHIRDSVASSSSHADSHLGKSSSLSQATVEERVSPGVIIASTATPAVHEVAAKEKAAAKAQQRQFSMPRGGPRRGGDRNVEYGPDGWTTAGGSVSRPQPKAGDLSQFGKISKATAKGMGPSDVFTKKDNKRDSLFRMSSSSNMFSMLSQNPELAVDTAAKFSRPPGRINLGQGGVPEPPQREKLLPLPHTKASFAEKPPLPAYEESEAPVRISAADAKKIDEDAKEFLADKLVAPAVESKEFDAILVSHIFAPLEAVSKAHSEAQEMQDTKSPEFVERNVEALLNRLTTESFDSVSDQIISWVNRSENGNDGRTLTKVTRLVFENAIDEAARSEMYARLCRKMMETISPDVQDDGIRNTEGKPIAGGQLFRKYLLNRCQEDFERGWVAKETTAAAAAAKATHDQAIKVANERKGDESELYSDEYYAAQKAKRQGLGLIKFIGELFKLQMLTERIMHECIKKLLGNVENPEEEEIESLCQLLKTIGQLLDVPKARARMDVYFTRMKELCKSPNASPGIQFMLQDVIELRDRKWVARGGTTISAVREAAAAEAMQRMPRGVSRRGGDRNVESGGGSVSRSQPKAGDLSQFGKISKATAKGMGPSDVFTKKDNKRDSLFRMSSSSNMFSMLGQNPELAVDTTAKSLRKLSVDLGQGGVPEPPQRKKLQLLPRIKPTPAEETSPPASEEEHEVPVQMSEADAKKKIDEDVKEFFAVRSMEEADVYFMNLPEEYRFHLVDKLVASALESKEADAILVSEFFAQAASKGQCSFEVFEAGFMPMAEFLDDTAIDAPNAFKFMAVMLKGAGFDKDEERLSRLAGKSMDSDRLLQLVAS